jgi:hypothetical protein
MATADTAAYSTSLESPIGLGRRMASLAPAFCCWLP